MSRPLGPTPSHHPRVYIGTLCWIADESLAQACPEGCEVRPQSHVQKLYINNIYNILAHTCPTARLRPPL